MDINLNGSVAERCLSRRGFLRGVGLGGLTAVGMSLAACGSSSSTETTSSSASTSGGAVTGGTLNVSLPSSPKYLDPIKYTGTYEGQVIFCVCNNLVQYSMDLSKIVPELATDWTISDDGITA